MTLRTGDEMIYVTCVYEIWTRLFKGRDSGV